MKWKAWAGPQIEVKIFPVERSILHFICNKWLIPLTPEHLLKRLNAISWAHQLAGLPPIVSSAFVRATLAGLQHKLAKPKVKKEPITASMLTTLIESLGTSPTLSDFRLAAGALLSFAAFLQYNELSGLRCCDIRFTEQHMTVHITSSKTDQYRQGDSVVVARTRTITCPVAMMERYMLMAGIYTASSANLFHVIVHTRKGEKLRLLVH